MPATRRQGSRRYNLIYEQAAALPLPYLRCRVKGHTWSERVTVEALDRNHRRLRETCESCGAHNSKVWTLRGTQVGTSITYPDDYLFARTGFLETADRDILRAIYLRLVSGN